MENIFIDYEINQNTMALITSISKNYKTIVLEPDRQIYVREKPQKLIEKACLDHYASYEGIRDAVMKRHEIKRMVPIPINYTLKLIAFPTHAINDERCCWIFYSHVHYINTNPYSIEPSSKITFINGEELIVPISSHSLQTQMKRIKTFLK